LADVDASAELAAIGIAPREILAVRTSGAIEFVELANLGG
jgi:hypothetical protein